MHSCAVLAIVTSARDKAIATAAHNCFRRLSVLSIHICFCKSDAKYNEDFDSSKPDYALVSQPSCDIVSAMNEYQPPAGQGQPERVVTETPESVHARMQRKERVARFRSVTSTIAILLLAPVIAIVLTLYVFQSYQVDGPSMEQTLQNNDRLIVWKLPRTWARITGNQYVPNRGDIVILNESGLSSFGSETDSKQLVKRVIGLPGDHIVIKNNILTVYNSEHPNGFEPDSTLPYGQDGAIPPTTDELDVQLSSTELFVCGDNRPNSLDSRSFGPIQTSQVVGKLVARILPLSSAEKF